MKRSALDSPRCPGCQKRSEKGRKMDKFIPYEKLSPKKKRETDKEKRGVWYGINTVTRKPENPKAYNRKKDRKDIYNDI